MTSFLLVHGGSRDENVWAPIVPILQANGSSVRAPSLPDSAASTFEEHVSVVVTALREEPAPVTLVGHSYGGLVMTVAAARTPTAVVRMVYLDTAYPLPGRSLFDLISEAGADPVADFGLDSDPPFITALSYDEEPWLAIPKIYVRAVHSEFGVVSEAACNLVREHADDANWTIREIDARHNVMQDQPLATAQLLLEAAN
ncbi:alpha/beta hydrolase [Streptomyces erythrochromogenes]|uniref:alpha/beta fold hydrolase n=1 Tax=Streptomyces erythrochromogenes TaxID=285574 RepID=UPI00341BC2A4